MYFIPVGRQFAGYYGDRLYSGLKQLAVFAVPRKILTVKGAVPLVSLAAAAPPPPEKAAAGAV